jgi:HlyD family secretion protein
VNQVVTADEVVGELSAVTNDESMRLAQVDYESQLRSNEAAAAADQATIGNLQIQRSRAQGSLSKAEANLEQRKANLAAGIGTTNQVRSAEAEVNSFMSEIAGYDQQIRSIRDQARQREISLARVREQVTSTQVRVAAGAEVKSTVAGKVVRIAKQPGDLVRSGEVIAEIESSTEKSTLEIVAFVSSRVGQRIQPGHPAQVTVAGVPREEYGFLRGTVRSVSQYAETPEMISQTLRDSTISEASYRVTITPEPNPQTPTGYAWSTGTGPRTPITGGTPITVAVEVDQRAPISLVLPVIRGSFGG